jgi:hypothetical protein
MTAQDDPEQDALFRRYLLGEGAPKTAEELRMERDELERHMAQRENVLRAWAARIKQAKWRKEKRP